VEIGRSIQTVCREGSKSEHPGWTDKNDMAKENAHCHIDTVHNSSYDDPEALSPSFSDRSMRARSVRVDVEQNLNSCTERLKDSPVFESNPLPHSFSADSE
jgi:hypothetical protein